MRRVAALALFAAACVFVAVRAAAAGKAADARKAADLRELKQAAAALPAELAAAKRAGLALTVADLYPGGPVPAAENAAPLYRELDRRYSTLPGQDMAAGQDRSTALARVISGKATDAERRLAQDALTEWTPILGLLEQISRRPRCRFALQWEKGDAVDLPPFVAMGLAIRLLAARAVLSAEDGRWEEAFADLERCAVLVRHAGETPLLIMLGVQVALAGTADSGFQQVVRASAGDPRAVARARRAHEAMSAPPDLVRTLHGEMVFARMALRWPHKLLADYRALFGEPRERMDARALARYPEALLRVAFDARVISYYRRLVAALAKAGDDVPALKRGAGAVVAAEAARTGPSYWATREITEATGNLELSFGRAVALRRLREGLLALLEARVQAGTFPESLPNPPLDPFDGKPLRYRRQGEGFVLYSIGPDMKDDGGSPARSTLGPGDMVIAYP